MNDVLYNEEFLSEKKFKELFNSEVKKLKEKFKLFSDEEYKKNLEIELNEILNIYIKENSINFDEIFLDVLKVVLLELLQVLLQVLLQEVLLLLVVLLLLELEQL